MPSITGHSPEVSTRSVNPYARERLPKKATATQTDRQTDTLTPTDYPRPLFSTFRW